jgi:hypothetical protein
MVDKRATMGDVGSAAATPFEADEPALRRALRPPGPVRLVLSQCHADGATTIEVGGELDVLTAPRLSAEIDQVVRKAGRRPRPRPA